VEFPSYVEIARDLTEILEGKIAHNREPISLLAYSLRFHFLFPTESMVFSPVVAEFVFLFPFLSFDPIR
jgi:hypothetical protein